MVDGMARHMVLAYVMDGVVMQVMRLQATKRERIKSSEI